ncbi:MAG: hypothetical protein ABI950_00055 [Solirubrobacteraceae bacterium]
MRLAAIGLRVARNPDHDRVGPRLAVRSERRFGTPSPATADCNVVRVDRT